MQQCVRVVLPSERRAARTLRRPFAFAAIALPARGSAKFVQEPSTGLHLEAEHCVNRFACTQLQSTGVRVKRIAGLGVKVYALGIYVDAIAVKRVLAAKFKGKAPTAEACAEAVISLTDVERNLQLVFARSVDGATVASALAERLESKVGKASQALAAFKAAFAGAKLERGSVVNLSASKGGKLTVQINGATKTSLMSLLLVSALMEAYLGKDPVVADTKKAFGAALCAHLAS